MIRGSSLSERLDLFVGERHPKASPRRHAETADRVGSVFESCGFTVREQAVTGPHGFGRNVVARLSGVEQPDRRWIIGAHYDTVEGTPGADDNGVAVAGLMEIAAPLSRHRYRDTIELVAWDLEEQQGFGAGYAYGSRAMAREDGPHIAGVLDLEMIGCCLCEAATQRFPPGFGLLFPRLKRWVAGRDGRGDFLAVVTDRRSSFLAEALERAAETVNLPLAVLPVVGAARLLPDLYRSDHAAFWARRIPAVMLTDSADFRNEHYHQPTDTVDTLDFDFAGRVLETVLLAVGDLAGHLDEAIQAPSGCSP